MRVSGACLVLCLLCAAPVPAHAWTRTRVDAMSAHLAVQADGSAVVGLEIGLEVQGGWLSRFELGDLGPGLALDPDKPPWLVSDDGEKFSPELVARRDGSWRLEFPSRKRAPHRGHYRLGLVFRGGLALELDHTHGVARAEFALPAWPVSLENVEVSVLAPARTRAVQAEDLSERAAVSTEQRDLGGATLLEFRRIQLPRTTGWTLRFEIPSDAAEAAVAARGPKTTRALQAPPVPSDSLALALAVAALSLLKRRAVAARARRLGLSARYVVPTLGVAARDLAVAAACATSVGCASAAPTASLALLSLALALGLCRGFDGVPAAGPRPALRAVATADLRRARARRLLSLFGPEAWLDATTAPGCAALVALWALAALSVRLGGAVESWLGAGLLLTPLFVTGTRLQGSSPAAEALLALARLRKKLATAGIESDLLVEACGPARHLRRAVLRLRAPDDAPAGLCEVEFRLVEQRWLGRTRSTLALQVASFTESEADRRLADALPNATVRDSDGRVERMQPTVAPAREAAALLAWLAPAVAEHEVRAAA